jgi:hypothetical protein
LVLQLVILVPLELEVVVEEDALLILCSNQ